VEWSPSPVPQAQPGSDAEKQQDLRSPGARMNPFGRNVEPCRLPDKQTLAEEASVSVPLVANAEARPMLHEVTPGHNDAAGGRHKDSVKDGDDMHPLYESGNQSNVQRRTAETTQVDEVNGAMLQPGQYRMVAQYKEREFIAVRLPFSVFTLRFPYRVFFLIFLQNIAKERLVHDYLMHVFVIQYTLEQYQSSLNHGILL